MLILQITYLAGKLEEIKIWWETLISEGPKYGYYPKPSKSFLIVKQHYKECAEIIFAGSKITITTEGTRRLGTVFGDISFKEEYLRNEVVMEKSIGNTFKDSRNSTTNCLFCVYVRIQTQIHVFLTNSTWYSRLLTSDWKNIKIEFYTSYHRGLYYVQYGKSVTWTSSEIRRLRITELYQVANTELLNSKETTGELYEDVITQNKDFQIDNEKTKTIENELKRRKNSNDKIKLEELRNSMNEKIKRNGISNETGSLNWLRVIPMHEFNYVLNKQQFWYSIRLRYGWPISGLLARHVILGYDLT